MKNTDYILYLDMDGVLVDYSSGWFDLAKGMGIKPVGDEYQKTDLERVYRRTDFPEFWANLKWEHGGKQLWDAAVENFAHIAILSSAAAKTKQRMDAVVAGKREWIKKNLPLLDPENAIIVQNSSEKPNYSDKTSILVDDRGDTIKEWVRRGGYGIVHKASKYHHTIEELVDIARPLNLGEIARRVLSRRRFW